MPRFHYTPTTPDAGSIGDLMLRRGQIAGNRARTIADIEAQAAMARGQILGGTVANIAGSVGDLISGYARQKAEAPARAQEFATKEADLRLKETQIAEAEQKINERGRLTRQETAFTALLERGNVDPKEILAVYGPQKGLAILGGMKALYDLQNGEVADARETAGRLALGLQQLSPALRTQAWPQIRELTIKAGLGDEETIPAEPSAEYLKAIVAWSTGKAPEAPELMNVPPGGAVFNQETQQPVFTNPREPSNPTEASLAAAAAAGDKNAAEALRLLRAQRPEPQGETTPTPTARLNATRALRNDFVRETKAAAEVTRQFEQMQSSLSAVKQGALAAGSQGVLVTFQKILDPISVVRESEYARSASGLSLLNRLEGQWQTIQKGGAGVPVAELETFVKLAEQFSRNQARYAKETKQQIEGIARDFGLDPSHMTREFGPAEPSETDDAYAAYLKRQGAGRAR